MSDEDKLASQVGRVLRQVWDPIDLGARGPADEYDAYVQDLVDPTRDTAVFEDELIARLAGIEVEAMGLSLLPAKRTRAARALLGLRHTCFHRSGVLVEQRSSPNGLRCFWVFEVPTGVYAYEEGILQQEDDENGRWSWWADAGRGRSGLFDTAEAAGQEACAVIDWLRECGPGALASVDVPWDETSGWRAPDERERAVLDRLLAADFPGRNGLAAQAQTARVRRIDAEGSLRFQIYDAPTAVATRVPVEGHYWENDARSGPVVNLLLHVVNGRLHELEIYKDDGSDVVTGPFAVPLEEIEVSVNRDPFWSRTRPERRPV